MARDIQEGSTIITDQLEVFGVDAVKMAITEALQKSLLEVSSWLK